MGNDKATLSSASRWRKFVGDMGVYAVGNLGAKVLTFLMVPLYTYFIPDTSEFGYFDICLTATFLLTPLVTLGLRDGVFRFLLDAPDDAARRRVVSASFRLLARSLALWLAVLLLAAGVLPLSHMWLVLLLLLSVVANEVYGQLVRGLGLNRFFAGMGLATAVLIVVLSVVLVGWLGMGVAGIFIANAVARLLPVLVVELWHRPALQLLSASVDWRPTAREMLRYTLPLIPTVVIWWVLSFGDRWFVLWVAGTDANGVYAVAARFTGAIYAFTLVLQQAWQESAILQYGSDDRDTFFSQILAVFIYMSCLIVMVYLAALHLSYGWLVESNYAGSEAYLFPMAVSAVIFSLASFLEMGYQCSRETRGALLSSVLTGVLNVILNLLLAPRLGVWGVIASSLVSFTFFAVYRYVDTRRYFALRPGWRILVPVTMTLVVGVAGCVELSVWVYVFVAIGSIVVTLASLPRSLYNKLRQNALFKN